MIHVLVDQERNLRNVTEHKNMINPKCDKCKSELNEFGGILLSPTNDKSEVKKFHLCVNCYKEIEKEFN